MAKRTRKADAGVLVGKYLLSRNLGKRNYKRADAALESLLKVMKPGDVVATKSGRKYELVDQFAAKTVAFKLCGVPRYALEEVAEP